MKRIILIITVFLGLALPVSLVSQVAAVNISPNCGAGHATRNAPAVCQDITSQQGSTTDPIITIIKDVITVLSVVIGIAAVIGIMVSGLRFITANGDSNAIASARSGLITSLAGVVVAALAGVIVAFVLSKVH